MDSSCSQNLSSWSNWLTLFLNNSHLSTQNNKLQWTAYALLKLWSFESLPFRLLCRSLVVCIPVHGPYLTITSTHLTSKDLTSFHTCAWIAKPPYITSRRPIWLFDLPKLDQYLVRWWRRKAISWIYMDTSLSLYLAFTSHLLSNWEWGYTAHI